MTDRQAESFIRAFAHAATEENPMTVREAESFIRVFTHAVATELSLIELDVKSSDIAHARNRVAWIQRMAAMCLAETHGVTQPNLDHRCMP